MSKVLVVDDSAFMRMTLKHLLSQCGHEVVGEAEDAPSAVQKYQALKPDLVTMDIIMPVESGLEAVREIVKADPNAKIVMVSAMGQDKIVEEALSYGAKGFISKPVQKEKLEEVLKKVL